METEKALNSGTDYGFCLALLQSVHSNLSSSAASLQTWVCPQHQCTHSWPITSRDCLSLMWRQIPHGYINKQQPTQALCNFL